MGLSDQEGMTTIISLLRDSRVSIILKSLTPWFSLSLTLTCLRKKYIFSSISHNNTLFSLSLSLSLSLSFSFSQGHSNMDVVWQNCFRFFSALKLTVRGFNLKEPKFIQNTLFLDRVKTVCFGSNLYTCIWCGIPKTVCFGSISGC